MREPTVTIGIPTFNRLDTLRVCVASAAAQDYPFVEVIVCDNASDDGTADFLAQEQSRGVLRHIRHEVNQGAHLNFASALEAASGEYFMWLADDDWIDPDYVAACMDALTNGAVLAAGDATYLGTQTAHERAVDLTGRRWRRVLGYYRTVASNGTFYGITRTDLRRSIPLSDGLGGDWVHVARLAELGSIRRAATTIHRNRGGASDQAGDATLRDFVLPVMRIVRRNTRGRVLGAACALAVGWNWWARRTLVGIATATLRAMLPNRAYLRLRASVHRR